MSEELREQEITVKIKWQGDDPHWLTKYGVQICLKSYYHNTKFQVEELPSADPDPQVVEAVANIIRKARYEKVTELGTPEQLAESIIRLVQQHGKES